MNFASIDICFILIILFFSILCAVRGLVKELFGKASIVFALLGGIFWTPYLEYYMLKFIQNVLVAKILSFLLIFIIIFLLVCIVKHFVEKIFSGEILRGLDRTLGFVFGFLEGLLIVIAVIIAMSWQKFYDTTDVFKDSFFYEKLSFVTDDPISHIKEITD